jgi:hydroxypyruvate isomerase
MKHHTGVHLAAHLGFQFGEFAPLDRFAAAAQAGFKAVEWPALYEFPAEQLRRLSDEHHLAWFQATLPAGNAAAGEKGLAALPGREADFARALATGIDYARVLGARWIHPQSGVVPAWTDVVRTTYVANIRLALRQARAAGLGVMVEVINPKDIPGYAMGSYDLADEICREVADAGPLHLLLDAYHGQNMTGDLPALARRWAGRIAHVQIADVPGRHEPGTGTLDFDTFFDTLQAIGYQGWVGCEYKPRTTTVEGLRYLAPYLG